MALPLLPVLALTLSPAQPPARPHGFEQPVRAGVVFWQAKTPAEAIAELERVRAQGYNLIKQASWAWTLPTPGNDLERVMQAELDWCDANGFHFYLLQNVQYGSPGEGGDLDAAWEDPLQAARLLGDWVRVLEGHPCVDGVILGNEVGPQVGTPEANPQWWRGFTEALQRQYGTVEALNRSWGTDTAAWDALQPPALNSAGRVDLDRFATLAFERFYGTLFEQVLKPALGPLEYGVKTAGDPLLHRQLVRFSLVAWDDVLANYPQWRIKALCDVGRRLDRPVFNSELHVYHDDYVYNQSVAMTRYRYLMSALNGETTTASFAWGQWGKNPETVRIHAETPTVLAELTRLGPVFRSFATVEPELHVLLTRAYAVGDDADPETKPLAEALSAEVTALGVPWEFVCEEDVPSLTGGTLLLPEQPRPRSATVQAILGLPATVRLVCANEPPTQDEYGHMLPQALRAALARRATVVESPSDLRSPATDPGPPYNELTRTEYLFWNHEKGHFRAPMTYPRLEARRVREGDGWLVAVINHATAGEPVEAELPWRRQLGSLPVMELTSEGRALSADAQFTFPPLAVRLFRYSP
jgi:hypothetical protein